MVKFCEDVQARQEADNKNARETIFSVVDLHHRIGELTTQLERKGRETADWKGAAERLRAKLVDLEKRQTQQNSNYDEQITKSDAKISNLQNQLSVSQSREGNLQQRFAQLYSKACRVLNMG
jgi:predicted RNase H-like nuclease (RuvC/YqgF family)